MKKKWILLTIGLILFVSVGFAQASLTTIGIATYAGADYQLIYDDDDTGYGGGGLVWLDYTHPYSSKAGQKLWASGLGGELTVKLFPGYSTDIDWTTDWRLPDTVTGSVVDGYEGDPDNDGIYTYTAGYNLANSEIGHLYYTELGNMGYRNTDGSYNTELPPLPDRFLLNKGDFVNLTGSSAYWIGSDIPYNLTSGWVFYTGLGEQGTFTASRDSLGIAVHSGNVSTVPIPGSMCLLGFGLTWLIGLGRRKQK